MQKQGVEQKIFENFSIFLSLIANLRFDSPVTKGEVGNLFLLALGGKPFFMGLNHFYQRRPRNNCNLHKVGDTKFSVSQSLKLQLYQNDAGTHQWLLLNENASQFFGQTWNLFLDFQVKPLLLTCRTPATLFLLKLVGVNFKIKNWFDLNLYFYLMV